MRIVCMVCPTGAPEVEESKYPLHMQTVHGGSQATGRMINRNIPPSTPLPNGVSPVDLPTPEFLQTIEEMEQTPPPPKPTVAPPSVKIAPPVQPIQLTYRYMGSCENGHQVTTLEMDVEGKHFVVAYCLAESRQIESREVANLKKQKNSTDLISNNFSSPSDGLRIESNTSKGTKKSKQT